jgi:hypothetical protein
VAVFIKMIWSGAGGWDFVSSLGKNTFFRRMVLNSRKRMSSKFWLVLRIRITLMRVRIQIQILHVTLIWIRIWILPLTLMQIRIPILASKLRLKTLKKSAQIGSYSINFGLSSANWCGSASGSSLSLWCGFGSRSESGSYRIQIRYIGSDTKCSYKKLQ